MSYRPRRHWLFFGEIVELGSFLRLRMTIKDVDGKTIPLIFYTWDRGNGLDSSLFRERYSIAILYAEFHAFALSEPGIRLEQPGQMKVPIIIAINIDLP
jgi:hypothetical protein